MKELDKTKKYDLSKLTDGQLIELSNKTKELNLSRYFKDYGDLIYDVRNTDWKYLSFYEKSSQWYITKKECNNTFTCATELFEDEKYNIEFNNGSSIKLYNRTMTEEEKELWLFVYKESVKYHTFITHKDKAYQAVKDFREALKM